MQLLFFSAVFIVLLVILYNICYIIIPKVLISDNDDFLSKTLCFNEDKGISHCIMYRYYIAESKNDNDF